jgi:hypothetical protein
VVRLGLLSFQILTENNHVHTIHTGGAELQKSYYCTVKIPMLKDPLFKVFMMNVPEVQSCYCLKVLQCKVPTVQSIYWFKVRELDVVGIGYTWLDQIGLD